MLESTDDKFARNLEYLKYIPCSDARNRSSTGVQVMPWAPAEIFPEGGKITEVATFSARRTEN